jgi:hypothetical protein
MAPKAFTPAQPSPRSLALRLVVVGWFLPTAVASYLAARSFGTASAYYVPVAVGVVGAASHAALFRVSGFSRAARWLQAFFVAALTTAVVATLMFVVVLGGGGSVKDAVFSGAFALAVSAVLAGGIASILAYTLPHAA